ncbi:hypothetical protein M3P05_19790 [Sansalvadorimonas sp. 2012CJ34-2]|uniref:Uncharacterized protein n=1 Tax=Parendozoicomonas callyspongiae TaxID=2942213 RepID=A0ABT0PN53_9GAMM|nr:hypothetical protein [Sansalvadorimonas sp. 2012CJ34-2]MCL6272167.1 hypothetical protein [Sansalvadorimonas sp. 2012CJ34-2]
MWKSRTVCCAALKLISLGDCPVICASQLQKKKEKIILEIGVSKNNVAFLNAREQLPQKSLFTGFLALIGSRRIIQNSDAPQCYQG